METCNSHITCSHTSCLCIDRQISQNSKPVTVAVQKKLLLKNVKCLSDLHGAAQIFYTFEMSVVFIT